MSTLAAPAAAVPPARARRVFAALAWLEVRRYATHPIFLLGLAVVVATSASGPDPRTSSLFHAIVPAAAIGLAGVVVMWNITRRSDRSCRAAGIVPVAERTRTLALAAAIAVPFLVGLAWWVWAMVVYDTSPPPADGFPFGPADRVSWVAPVLFGLGPLACVGGPMLGLLVARWTRGRAAPALVMVGVVAATIVMQGLFEPLRTARVVMPWTYWGGPFDSGFDTANRMLVFSGAPGWWIVHVACLSALGLLLALAHDRERPRRPLIIAGAVVLVVSLVSCALAMTTGIDSTLVNPLPGPS